MNAYRQIFLFGAASLILFGLLGAVLIAGDGSARAFFSGPLIGFLLSPWMIATEALSLGLLTFGAWQLTRGRIHRRDAPNASQLLKAERRRLWFVFFLFVVGSITIAIQYSRDLRNSSLTQARQQVEGIAQLKAQQLEKWIYERSIDASLFASTLKSFPLEQWSSDREMRSIVEVLVAEMLAGHAEKIAVALYGNDGNLLTSAGVDLPATGIAGALAAVTGGNRATTVYQLALPGRPEGLPLLLFLAPIHGLPGGGKPAAIAVVAVDPALDLLPSLHAWPVQSASGEITVGRRDGDTVVAIQAPNSRDGKVSARRFPITDRSIPMISAIIEGRGTRTGIDPLGHAVLYASAQPKDIDWMVVAKVDQSEVFAGAEARTRVLVFVVAGAIFLAGFLLVILWQSQRSSVEHYQLQQERERLAINHHYQRMFKAMRECALLLDSEGRIVDANDAALQAYGYDLDEFRKLNIRDLRAPEYREKVDEEWRSATRPQGALFETVHQRKDGTRFFVEVASNPYIENDGTTYQQSFIRDISARKAMELSIARLARVKKALFAAAEVVLRASSEKAIYDGICRVLAEDAGYRVACIQEPVDDPEKSIRIAAAAGPAIDYVAHARISWGDNELGRGPTGVALRTGEIQINQNFSTNPNVKAWRHLAISHGLNASICLPLEVGGKNIADLTLYAAEPDAFDYEEVDLLRHLADVMRFGIEALRNRQRHDGKA